MYNGSAWVGDGLRGRLGSGRSAAVRTPCCGRTLSYLCLCLQRALLISPASRRRPSADLGEFLRVIEKQKLRAGAASIMDADLLDAFVACGGMPDGSGIVERATLVRIIKVDFGLTIDIEELIDNVDKDGSGEIEYGEFKVRQEGSAAAACGGEARRHSRARTTKYTSTPHTSRRSC